MSGQSSIAAATPLRVRHRAHRAWRWSQHWRNVFFAHWQVPADGLRCHLPAGLELDTHGGTAWVSAVAFRLERVRFRWVPPLALGSSFAELNLRTYVRLRSEAAIYFISIHAGGHIGVALARWFTPLPYHFVPITYRRAGEVWCFDCGRPGQRMFAAEFRPGEQARAAMASLDAWLLERYVGFAAGRHGTVQRVAVEHRPWQVQPVTGRVTATSLGEPWGLALGESPTRLHFAAGVMARVWPFEPVCLA